MLKTLLPAILPQSCILCEKALLSATICPDCLRRLPRHSAPVCSRCGHPLPPTFDPHALCSHCRTCPPGYDRMRSAYLYEEPLKSLLHAYKYRERWKCADDLKSAFLNAAEELPMSAIDGITSVPSPWFKDWFRPYAPVKALAQHVACHWRLAYSDKALRWRAIRKPQHHLSRIKRLELRPEHFSANPRIVQNKAWLLIDDIITTGATVSACSQALKIAGATQVFVLALAQTPLHTTSHAHNPITA